MTNSPTVTTKRSQLSIFLVVRGTPPPLLSLAVVQKRGWLLFLFRSKGVYVNVMPSQLLTIWSHLSESDQMSQITWSVRFAKCLPNPRWFLQKISDLVIFRRWSPKCGGFLQFTPTFLKAYHSFQKLLSPPSSPHPQKKSSPTKKGKQKVFRCNRGPSATQS